MALKDLGLGDKRHQRNQSRPAALLCHFHTRCVVGPERKLIAVPGTRYPQHGTNTYSNHQKGPQGDRNDQGRLCAREVPQNTPGTRGGAANLGLLGAV